MSASCRSEHVSAKLEKTVARESADYSGGKIPRWFFLHFCALIVGSLCGEPGVKELLREVGAPGR